MIIAIDFDNTIVKDKWPKIGELLPKAKEIINKLYDKGHTIIIWTCRDDDDLVEAVQFLTKNDIKFDYINQNDEDLNFDPQPKIYYDILIDDKTLYFNGNPVNWDIVEKLLIKIKAL